jgi:hypothetical protein
MTVELPTHIAQTRRMFASSSSELNKDLFLSAPCARLFKQRCDDEKGSSTVLDTSRCQADDLVSGCTVCSAVRLRLRVF